MTAVPLRCVPVGGLCLYAPKPEAYDIFWTADGNIYEPLLPDGAFAGDAFFLTVDTYFIVVSQPILIRNRYWVPIMIPYETTAYATLDAIVYHVC